MSWKPCAICNGQISYWQASLCLLPMLTPYVPGTPSHTAEAPLAFAGSPAEPWIDPCRLLHIYANVGSTILTLYIFVLIKGKKVVGGFKKI